LVPAYIVPALDGSPTRAKMDAPRPAGLHVAPESVERKTPRLSVPTYTVLGVTGSTTMPSTSRSVRPTLLLVHVAPPLTLFRTPAVPPNVPT
jgi:hypothetical protein